jgi:hypothetical protein
LALILIPTFVSIVGKGSKPSPKVGFHEMDEVYSLHHFLELLPCLSPLHLATTRQVPFLPLLILETSE